MAEINFTCPHCGQDLTGPEDMAGETIDCPVCEKSFHIPGGIIELPGNQLAPPPRPSAPAPAAPDAAPAGGQDTASIPRAASDDDKGKTVRIELPPEFLQEPEKHIFKIKRIQR